MSLFARDIYSSRQSTGEVIVPRRDPVVYTVGEAQPRIESALLSDYESNGYAVVSDLLEADLVSRLQREAEWLRLNPQIIKREEVVIEPGNGAVRSIFDVQEFSSIFKGLMHDARLVNFARHVLGDEVYLHQARLNYKPGFEGQEFYWHSDFETWHVEDGMPRMRALSMSIALTKNRASNGPVMLIPGSHRYYVSCDGLTPKNNYKSSLRRQECGVPSCASLEQLVGDKEIAVVTGGAGSVLVFDCNTMHGSTGNITPYDRVNLFFVYNAVSNQLGRPCSGQPPRPEFIARRSDIRPIEPMVYVGDGHWA